METALQDNIQAIFDKAECLHTLADINKALDQLANALTAVLKGTNPLILCVMTGGVIPTGHLLTRLAFPLELDYIHATRYRGTTRGMDLHWLVEPRHNLKDRTVLVLDDIMDGGLTLGAILDYCRQQEARRVYSAVMVSKNRVREPGADFEPDFVGLTTDDRYLFGFGLDYKEYWRNAPGIYAVNE